MVRDEGVIKFNCRWIEKSYSELNQPILLTEKLIKYRNDFYNLNLIGEYEDGIGFGNISVRNPNYPEQFLISGSATGGVKKASEKDFSLVTRCDLNQNTVYCEGPIQASSESMTHFMLYQTSIEIKAIVHCHHPALWEKNKNILPTSRENVPYGTPAMASEIKRLYDSTNLPKVKTLVMAGHEDGIISFGSNFDEIAKTYQILLNG